jgi:hypothetical protein
MAVCVLFLCGRPVAAKALFADNIQPSAAGAALSVRTIRGAFLVADNFVYFGIRFDWTLVRSCL